MSTIAPTRDEWLARRRTGIGASEAAAAIGVCPYKSPFQLWAEKVGVAEPDDISGKEAVEFGVRLEVPICEAFAERTGRVVDPWSQTQSVRHPELPFLFCTPDAMQYEDCREGKGTLQIKTTSAWNAGEWEECPPLHHQVQAQTEMAVTGVAWGTLCVLIGGQKLRYFDIDRNDKFIAALLPRLGEFWSRVESQIPPDVDGSLATAKTLLRLHPDDTGGEVFLPDEAIEWAAEIEACKDTAKEVEARQTLAENRLKAAIGDNTFGIMPDGSRWSWKTQERAAYQAKSSKFRVLKKMKG